MKLIVVDIIQLTIDKNEHKSKGALIQIWKFPYMFKFILKQYPENLAFLALKIIELFTRKLCIFLKE